MKLLIVRISQIHISHLYNCSKGSYSTAVARVSIKYAYVCTVKKKHQGLSYGF